MKFQGYRYTVHDLVKPLEFEIYSLLVKKGLSH